MNRCAWALKSPTNPVSQAAENQPKLTLSDRPQINYDYNNNKNTKLSDFMKLSKQETAVQRITDFELFCVSLF